MLWLNKHFLFSVDLADDLLLFTPPPPERPVVRHQIRPAHRQEAGAVLVRVGQGEGVAHRRGGHGRVSGSPAAAAAGVVLLQVLTAKTERAFVSHAVRSDRILPGNATAFRNKAAGARFTLLADLIPM